MRTARPWYMWLPVTLTTALWLAACEPQRPDVIDEVEVEETENDRPPAHRVEPVVDDDEEEPD
jgi:hypothetical protein